MDHFNYSKSINLVPELFLSIAGPVVNFAVGTMILRSGMLGFLEIHY